MALGSDNHLEIRLAAFAFGDEELRRLSESFLEFGGTMHVYLLRSVVQPTKTYVGVTSDFARRFAEHNGGDCPSTYRFRPWRCVARIWFDDAERAGEFEAYLKTGSGRRFARRRLL